MAASDKTYFVGRSELLGWINTTLGTTITKVEEVSQVPGTERTLAQDEVACLCRHCTLLNCAAHDIMD